MLTTALNLRSLLLSLILLMGLSGFAAAQTDSLTLSGRSIGGSSSIAHPNCVNTPRFIVRDAESARFVLQYNGQVAQVSRRLFNLLKDKAQFKANRICAQKNCLTGDCKARLVHQESQVFARRKQVHGQTIVYLTVKGKFWFKCGCN